MLHDKQKSEIRTNWSQRSYFSVVSSSSFETKEKKNTFVTRVGKVRESVHALH